MSHFSRTQKVLLALSFILFIAFNLYSLSIVFPDTVAKVKEAVPFGSNSTAITVKTKDGIQDKYTISKYKVGETVNIVTGMNEVQVLDIATLVLNAPGSFVYSDGALVITNGLVFIKPQNPLNLKIDQGSLKLEPGQNGIYDAGQKIYLITDGELVLNSNKTARAGDYLAWEVDSFNNYPYERKVFNEEYSYISLRKTLEELAFLPSFIEDITPPNITLISPSNEVTTNDAQIEITINTEATTEVHIGIQKLTADTRGNVSSVVPLYYGENKIKITAIDKSGNQNEIEITVYRENQPEESPQSYPISYELN